MATKRRDPKAALLAARAMDLRKLGMTYEQIAKQCGYRDRAVAYNAVQRELQRTVQESADELRRIEGERLDDLWRAMIPKALKGDTWSVDRCLSIMDRRAKLLGLDARESGSTAQIVVVAIAQDILEAV